MERCSFSREIACVSSPTGSSSRLTRLTGKEYGTVRLLQFLSEARQDFAGSRLPASCRRTWPNEAGSANFKDDVSLVLLEWVGTAS